MQVVRSEDRKFLYSKIAKNAGTSIFRFVIEKEVPDSELLQLRELPSTDGYFAFTIVRNPYDRIVSLWNYFVTAVEKRKEIPSCSFREFLENDYINYSPIIQRHAVPQYNRIFSDGFTVRMENLRTEWRHIAQKIGVSQSLPRKNKHRHLHYTKYYDRWCINKVQHLYSRDIETLGYKFR